jgi:uracil-DNA glycosylase
MQFLGHEISNIHNSWSGFIKNQTENLRSIEEEISACEYTPDKDKILRFLEVDLQHIKVVILGQDPYPQKGVATGRAFEVGTLKSWGEKFKNVSLKNIIRAIYKSETGYVLKYSELTKDKLNQTFQILPPSKLFAHWEEQGVLLLNTSFTCEIGKPGSHAKYWQSFTQDLLTFIAEKNEKIKWFLWGDHAMKAVENVAIKKENIISSFHPMMCYDRENDFLYTTPNCFEKTKEIVDWIGIENEGMIEQKSLF